MKNIKNISSFTFILLIIFGILPAANYASAAEETKAQVTHLNEQERWETLIKKGNELVEKCDYEEAINIYIQADRIHSIPELKSIIAGSYLKIDQHNKALPYALSAIREFDTKKESFDKKMFFSTYFYLGEIYQKMGSLQTSTLFYEKALKYTGDGSEQNVIIVKIAENFDTQIGQKLETVNFEGYLYKENAQSNVLYKNNNNEPLDPMPKRTYSFEYCMQNGKRLFFEKKYSKASQWFNQAASVRDSALANYWLAKSYFALDEYKKAFVCYRKSLELNRSKDHKFNHNILVEAHMALGRIHYKQKDFVGAKHHFDLVSKLKTSADQKSVLDFWLLTVQFFLPLNTSVNAKINDCRAEELFNNKNEIITSQN